MGKDPIVNLGLISHKAWEDPEGIHLKALCILKISGSRESLDTDLIQIDTAAGENIGRIKFAERFGKRLPKGFRLNSFELVIDRKTAESLDIQNRLIVNYGGKYSGRMRYNLTDGHTGHNKRTDIFIKDGVAVYFRQSKKNSVTLTVRDANLYDTPEGHRRIEKAYKAAQINKKKRKSAGLPEPILMYEKNCSRYEESASVLYEKLIDNGYDNVYYVINEDNPVIQEIGDKYKKNLVWKDSDRHLELFFECDKFISSETMAHALMLRTGDRRIREKLESSDNKYVFLQHGVMYMVSLDSALRVGFRQKEDFSLHKTVVSSEAEAMHFIELAGMKRDDLYITGLAKFDKCVRNDGADKIIIMPTWRRWETNQAKNNVEETGYYAMIETMYNAVPDNLKDKVVVLPHPLITERFSGESEGLGGHILLTDSYDKVLRDCSLLITDYSSIAYDAFYRGANVIFYWKDKDECMTHYGEGTHLMLNEGNVFGPVCWDQEEMTEAIKGSYGKPQRDEDVERYRHLVEFHDGKNSERIMAKLIEDGMLEKR